MTTSPTRTAPARPPAGWWTGHPHYLVYVLFTATGFVLVADCALLLCGIRALGQGSAAWYAYLDALGSPLGTLLCVALLIGTLFFALRWLWVGVKIPLVQLGPLPAPPEPVIFVAHFAGLIGASALLLLILWGVIL